MCLSTLSTEYFRFTGIVPIRSLPTFSKWFSDLFARVTKSGDLFRKLSHSDASKPPISITLIRKVMIVQTKEGCSKSSALKRKSALLPQDGSYNTKFRMISSCCSRRLREVHLGLPHLHGHIMRHRLKGHLDFPSESDRQPHQ